MPHYHEVDAYVANHQRQLLEEAATERLLNTRRVRTRMPTRVIIVWLGNLLISAGMKLKSAYEAESAASVNAANYTQSG